MSCRDSLNGSYTFDCTNLSEVNQPHTQGSKRENRPTHSHTICDFWVRCELCGCVGVRRVGGRVLAVGLSGVPPLLSVAYSSSAPRGKFCRSLLRGGELPTTAKRGAHGSRHGCLAGGLIGGQIRPLALRRSRVQSSEFQSLFELKTASTGNSQ